MAAIQAYKLTRVEIPSGRILGDRNVRVERLWVGILELFDTAGQSGLGFSAALLDPMPTAAALNEYFARSIWPALHGNAPQSLLHRVSRPRGGNWQSVLHNLDNAIDQALWDLAARQAQMPLYRFLGGKSPEVAAYASGLCYHFSEEQLHAFYARAAASGYQAFKVKVGHRDLEWDVQRLRIVSDATGGGGRLMVDSNEGWTPNETIRRIRRYEEAGFHIHWVEDPILRTDFAGLRHLRQALGTVQVNSGEYLDADAKLALIAAEAVDIVNINDGISDGLRVARVCAARGLPVTLGNTIMNIGAHLGAALPEVDMVEDSQLAWTAILAEPIPIVNGNFVLNDRIGHGLALNPDAVREYGGA